jgi:hypothetical protein
MVAKKITYADIKALNPCYDPIKYIPVTYKGTLKQILKLKNVPAKDRLWVAVREQYLTLKQIHAYGLACARLSEQYSTDARVKQCNDVVERYLAGKATADELWVAELAAWSAARSAAESAWSMRSAAWAAAVVAESAAGSAAWSARVAAESAWAAAGSAAEEKQILALLKILNLKRLQK